MENSKIYLDHNASSPLLPEASAAMTEIGQVAFANPSSPHWAGREARILLEESREKLAQALGAKPQEIFFTSGGSESNNAVLRQLLTTSAEKHLISSTIEHPSVLETCRILAEQKNIQFTELTVDSNGTIDAENLNEAIRQETALISLISANNETGKLQSIEELTKIAKQYQIPFHTDLTQAFGKIQLDLSKSRIDYATATAHKLGGPRGRGLLYVREGTPFQPLITGGKQERARRAGTETVKLAVGFANAVEWYLNNQYKLREQFLIFRKSVLDEIAKLDGIFINTDIKNSLPHTINFGCDGISAESLLISLDMDGIAVSTGSACSSGAMEASHVLLAMGLSHADAKSSIRVSWGWSTTQAEIDHFCARLTHHIVRLKAKL